MLGIDDIIEQMEDIGAQSVITKELDDEKIREIADLGIKNTELLIQLTRLGGNEASKEELLEQLIATQEAQLQYQKLCKELQEQLLKATKALEKKNDLLKKMAEQLIKNEGRA